MKHNLSYRPKLPSIKLVRVKGVVNDLSIVILWLNQGWIIKIWAG